MKDTKTIQQMLDKQADEMLEKEAEKLFPIIGINGVREKFNLSNAHGNENEKPIEIEWYNLRDQLKKQYIKMNQDKRRKAHSSKFLEQVDGFRDQLNDFYE